ncbi:hypothetical protein IF1G_06969 [Cordyceps javanica]|uniref:Uncharacterized protein n=1 Tax=Cordyceps javanica TaxID=43265 RepID=A0A545UXB0_9HYPO|nr:hypothetical protein IF1G_06969 [Cordyceps javanica]
MMLSKVRYNWWLATPDETQLETELTVNRISGLLLLLPSHCLYIRLEVANTLLIQAEQPRAVPCAQPGEGEARHGLAEVEDVERVGDPSRLVDRSWRTRPSSYRARITNAQVGEIQHGRPYVRDDSFLAEKASALCCGLLDLTWKTLDLAWETLDLVLGYQLTTTRCK